MPTLIVPYHRARRRHRAVNMAFLRRRLRALHPEWDLCIAEADPWSKARAVNRAAKYYSGGSPLVVHDNDCLVSPSALRAAVEAVEAGAPWAIPHGHVYRLNYDLTRKVYRAGPTIEPGPLRPTCCDRKPYRGLAGGGIFVVSSAAWATVGGFDERFEGWGSEDTSLGYALETLTGPAWRGEAPLWHLYHPSADRTSALDASQSLEAKYLHARGRPDMMAELVAEG